jgi:hypothetical protein
MPFFEYYYVQRFLVVVLRSLVSLVGYIVKGGLKSYPDEARDVPTGDG